jgi:hypothetical protein
MSVLKMKTPHAWHLLLLSSQGADADSSPALPGLSRSVAWGGGSFIAGHSAFARHGAYSGCFAQSPASSRLSLDNQTATPAGALQADCFEGHLVDACEPCVGLVDQVPLSAAALSVSKQSGAAKWCCCNSSTENLMQGRRCAEG